MSAMASQITDVSIVYSAVCSGTDQRKHQRSASLGLCEGNSGPAMTSFWRWHLKFPLCSTLMTSSNGNISALLALCDGNSPRLNKRLSKPSRRRWFETPLRPLWRHRNVSCVFECALQPLIRLFTYQQAVVEYCDRKPQRLSIFCIITMQ